MFLLLSIIDHSSCVGSTRFDAKQCFRVRIMCIQCVGYRCVIILSNWACHSRKICNRRYIVPIQSVKDNRVNCLVIYSLSSILSSAQLVRPRSDSFTTNAHVGSVVPEPQVLNRNHPYHVHQINTHPWPPQSPTHRSFTLSRPMSKLKESTFSWVWEVGHRTQSFRHLWYHRCSPWEPRDWDSCCHSPCPKYR